MTSPQTVIGAAIAIGSVILGVYIWVGKHISNSKKHPCKDDIVFEDVCTERGKANKEAHEYLKEGITAAIARSDEQHKELKNDMKAGFDRLETLIKNGR